MMSLAYTIRRITGEMPADGWWASPQWRGAETLEIGLFRPESSDHHPRTRAQVLHDDRHIYVRFDVQDRYVRAVATQYQDMVCRDSCVEFFVWPKASKGYLNFEMNCGGTLLLYYIEDATRTDDGFAGYTPVSPEHGRQVAIYHSMPQIVMPERTDPVHWQLACRIPLGVLEAYVGPVGRLSGQTWRGNFYKCADHTSHPHWASWAPIAEELNFHVPACFAELRFE